MSLFSKIVYKERCQREAWGSFDFPSILPDYYSQESSWRAFFPRGKRKTSTEPVIPDREALPFGALSYLHVGTNSGGSGLKLGTGLGHGWVERGSSQVIRLTDLRLELSKFLLIMCV